MKSVVSAPVAIRFLIILTFVSCRAAELACKCSNCKASNYTCRTTTKCVYQAMRDSAESSSWSEAYYCERGDLPPNCERRVESTYILECCDDGDMCNERFSLPPSPTTTIGKPDPVGGGDGVDDPSNGNDGTNVVIFVVAGVSVFVMILLTVVILVVFFKHSHRAHQYDLERQRTAVDGGGDRDGAAPTPHSHHRRGGSRSATRGGGVGVSAHRSESADAQAYCQCCREPTFKGARDSKKKTRRVRSHSAPPRRHHSYVQQTNNNNRQKKYMTANNKTAYSVRGEFSRPPFAVHVDPESQSPMPSKRHHLHRVPIQRTNDQSSSTGSDSTTSWLSTDSRKPITKKNANSPV